MTKISIIIPVQNAEATIEKTIYSVLNQTFDDFELICVNYGSNDKTNDILKSFVSKDNRVKVFNTEYKTIGAVLNEALGLISQDSEYLYFINQDDELFDLCLEKMYINIKKNKQIMLICSSGLSVKNLPLCSRIISKDFFIQNNIKFSENDYDEYYMPVQFEIDALTSKIIRIKDELYSVQKTIKIENPEVSNYYTISFIFYWVRKYAADTEKYKIIKAFYNILNNFISELNNKIILNELIPIIKLSYRGYKRYKLKYYVMLKLYKIKLSQRIKRNKKKGKGTTLLDTVDVLNVGKYTYCSAPPVISDRVTTSIGKFCSFGSNIQIGQSSHPVDYLSTSPYLYLDALGFKTNKELAEFSDKGKPITIGNDVWIGNNVCIKNKVSIGDGAVVGMGAIVTKDVPPYAIVAGIPAKVIRYRFDEQTIAKLLELKWWDLDDEIIKQIPFNDINKAIEFLTELRNRTISNKSQH